MPIEVTVQHFPVLVVTGIMVLKKKHIIHLYVGSCNQAKISNSRFQWNLSQHDAKKGAHVNPPALGSCEMSGFSKLQKDILALIDAAIQLKFLMHLGCPSVAAKEKGVLVNVLDANLFFLGEMLKVWYSTPLTYRSQVQMECSWTPQQHVLLQCQPIWEALQKRSTPQLPSSTKYINHIHNAPLDYLWFLFHPVTHLLEAQTPAATATSTSNVRAKSIRQVVPQFPSNLQTLPLNKRLPTLLGKPNSI